MQVEKKAQLKVKENDKIQKNITKTIDNTMAIETLS